MSENATVDHDSMTHDEAGFAPDWPLVMISALWVGALSLSVVTGFANSARALTTIAFIVSLPIMYVDARLSNLTGKIELDTPIVLPLAASLSLIVKFIFHNTTVEDSIASQIPMDLSGLNLFPLDGFLLWFLVLPAYVVYRLLNR